MEGGGQPQAQRDEQGRRGAHHQLLAQLGGARQALAEIKQNLPLAARSIVRYTYPGATRGATCVFKLVESSDDDCWRFAEAVKLVTKM